HAGFPDLDAAGHGLGEARLSAGRPVPALPFDDAGRKPGETRPPDRVDIGRQLLLVEHLPAEAEQHLDRFSRLRVGARAGEAIQDLVEYLAALRRTRVADQRVERPQVEDALGV